MDIIFSTLFDTNLPKIKFLRYTDHMDMTIHTYMQLTNDIARIIEKGKGKNKIFALVIS